MCRMRPLALVPICAMDDAKVRTARRAVGAGNKGFDIGKGWALALTPTWDAI